MVAGREVSPKDVSATQRLMAYWAHGEGAAKHQRATGARPGHAPGEHHGRA